MNTDIPVLEFSDEFDYYKVLNNQYLPFCLRDYIKETSNFSEALKYISAIKDFLVSRTLNFSRENAKIILNVSALSQSLKTDEKLKIVYACKALNFEDNFWLREEDSDLKFNDVNLRQHKLSDVSYIIAILGKHISATRDELIPDLMSGGLFPKYWHRNNDHLELWKTDKSHGINSRCEVLASRILLQSGVKCIKYWHEVKDGLHFSVCNCFTDNNYSLVHATDIIDWCNHTKQLYKDYINLYIDDFATMVICDYVLGNTDRHSDNYGFLIDNTYNSVIGLAPLYDFNQALVIDQLNNSEALDSLIYEPCNMTFRDSIDLYKTKVHIDFKNLKGKSLERYKSL